MFEYGLSLLQCIESQTFHSTDCITADFSNSLPAHDHRDYFSHLCYIKVCQLFLSSPLFLLPRNKTQIWEKRTKYVALYNICTWITQYLLTYIQNFLLLLPPNQRNKYSGSCLPSVHHTLNPVWLHCPEADLAHHSSKAERNAQHIPVTVLVEWQTACTRWHQLLWSTAHLWWLISAEHTNTDLKTKLLTQIPMWRIIDGGLLLL